MPAGTGLSQRRKDEIWERRVEAERTEVEPERAMEVWSGWNAAPGLTWPASRRATTSWP